LGGLENYLKEHLRALDLAARSALPEQIDEKSDPPVTVIRELVEAGYLWAIDASTFDGDAFIQPRITLSGREYLAQLQDQLEAQDRNLIATLDRLKNTLVSVATGGPPIKDVNSTYREDYLEADSALRKKGISNPIPFTDLWAWHGRWSGGDLPNYRSRREFIAAIFNPLFARLRSQSEPIPITQVEQTGWARVDRAVTEIRHSLGTAKTEEQFQTVGLLCREVLISLAQAVHDPSKHPPLDGVAPSQTDAKRLLEAYIAVELAGSSHEAARKHARAAFDLAVDLQHRRTATFRQAMLCAEATASVVNVIAITSGHRDPP